MNVCVNYTIIGKTEKIIKINKKTLVLGNGFDLDLGLKTRFSDFANSEYWPFKTVVKKGSLSSFLNKCRHLNEWFDLENSLALFATSPQYAALVKEDDVKEEFSLLIDSFMDYLEKEEREVCLNDNSVAAQVLRCVLSNGMYENVYTFNFTNLKSIAEKLGIPLRRSVIHVHGSLEGRSAIIGFNESENALPKLGFMYKTFNRNYKSNSLRHDLSDSQEIVIFGHSLGNIDYSYFDNMFLSLVKDSKDSINKRKVTIFTYDDKSRLEIMVQLRNMNERKTELLYGFNDFNVICTDGSDEQKVNEFIEYQRKNTREKTAITNFII